MTGLKTPAQISSDSLDMPVQLQELLAIPLPEINQGAVGVLPVEEKTIQTMQEGGPMPPAGLQTGQPMPTPPMNPNMMNTQVDQSMTQNPELVARIRAAIEAGLETGELTTQELNMMVELARTVMQNPAMYPQIRQLAIERGLATEADLPPEYDEGLLIAILMVGKSLEADVQFGASQSDMPQGGMLEGPSHAQGGIPVKAGGGLLEMEGGEYVIPRNVVKAKGTEFFDKMIKHYEEGGEVK